MCVHVCIYAYMENGVFPLQPNSLWLPRIWQSCISLKGLWSPKGSRHGKPPVHFQPNFFLILSSWPALEHWRVILDAVEYLWLPFSVLGYAERAIIFHCLMSWNEKKRMSFKCWLLTFFSAALKKLDVWFWCSICLSVTLKERSGGMESLFQMEVLTASLQITCWTGLDSDCAKLHVLNDVTCLLQSLCWQ